MGNKTKKSNFFVRFLGNKNTVTILGMLACVATLVIGYTVRVNTSINPTVVPYAKEMIESRTLITADMLGKVKVSESYLSTATNVVKNQNEVVNKYASYKTSIPKGSLIYKEMVKTADEMPDYAWTNIAKGQTIFSLNVTNDETFGGKIHPGEYIDLYIATNNPAMENKVIFAKLIESIRVMAVKDSAGNNILEGQSGKVAGLQFAVPEEIFLILKRATNLRNIKIDIIPVIRNHNYSIQAGDVSVPLQQLIDFINERVTRLG